ncbi:MAG: 2-alkenal reductase [Acidobacteria bacterium]|nr:2-alkenal reductase [Acidobacteriota bacterium]|tara:strand:- start:515 stop:1717 length:1203 start_codon:yes stop_codon:yes gene_type:complete
MTDPQDSIPLSRSARLGTLFAWLVALAGAATAGCSVDFTPSTQAIAEEPEAPAQQVSGDKDRPSAAQLSDIPPPYTDLRADEQARINLFENTSPSVVYISTVTRRTDFFGRGVNVPQGSGTGFMWDDEGHIVTNYHVIQGASSARVVMHDQTSHIALWVGGSPRHDLAVLKIDTPADTLSQVTIGDSDRLRVGQSVYAIGNPFGLNATLTTGIVSALNRQIPGLTSGDIIENVIQIDAAINPGNSGGPLLDSQGRLIGVNSQIASPSGASAGVGFAVPVNTVERVVPQLIANGEYTPAQLGISAASGRLNQLVAQRLGVSGVLIAQIVPGSGADRAGLQGTDPNADQLGDIIVEVDGDTVSTLSDLRIALDRYEPGDEVDVSLYRDGDVGRVETVRVRLM